MVMDRFASHGDSGDSPATEAFAITPSDSGELLGVTKAILSDRLATSPCGRCEAARTSIYAIVQKRVDGLTVGPESSSARFSTVQAERAVCEFIVEYVPEALAGSSAFLQMHHQRGIVAGIASGAAEIQLNIIASDVLQLPREPR